MPEGWRISDCQRVLCFLGSPNSLPMTPEAPPSPPSWKRLWLWLCKHRKELLGLPIVGSILTAVWLYGVELWNGLLTHIQNYPAQSLCWVALGTTTFAVWLAFLYWRISKFSLKKALEDAERIDDLEKYIASTLKSQNVWMDRCKELEGPADVLASGPTHRTVLVFLLKFKQGTFIEVSNGALISQQDAQLLLRDLELKFDLVERNGITLQGHSIYTLNAKGRAYAEAHRIEPGNQNMGEIRASDAEKEAQRLRDNLEDARPKIPPAPKPERPGGVRLPGQ